MVDLLFAAFACTLEDMAPMAINIPNIWNQMKECINW
jgi:hypothetical protein